MPDFYLQGVQIHEGQGSKLYRFHNSTFALVGATIKTATFGEAYADMGWNKSQDGLTITLNDVNTAFFEFYGGIPSKSSFRTIVVAFAEGCRFDKIARKVAKGEQIAGKELDWSADGATVYQGQ